MPSRDLRSRAALLPATAAWITITTISGNCASAIFKPMRPRLLLLVAVAFGITSYSFPQDASEKSPEVARVTIELRLYKKVFAVDEPIRFRILLVNRSSYPIYVAKTFEWARGGIPGFFFSMKQLSGRAPSGCGGLAGDAFKIGGRSPEQILKEDYLLLPPGAIIGFESTYKNPCTVMHPGVYEIGSEYYADPFDANKLHSANPRFPVLQGTVRSNVVRIRMQQKSSSAHRSR